jgi:subtilase family serine protease
MNGLLQHLWQQAAAEGISVFVSSGDAGSSMCDVPDEYFATPFSLGVNALASTPYNTAVGGTEFADTNTNTYWNTTVSANLSSAKGYIPEAVWNESCNTNIGVSADNCYFDPTEEGTYAGGGGASNCAVHPRRRHAQPAYRPLRLHQWLCEAQLATGYGRSGGRGARSA